MWPVLVHLRANSGSEEHFGKNSEHWAFQPGACWTQPPWVGSVLPADHMFQRKDKQALGPLHCLSLYEAWALPCPCILWWHRSPSKDPSQLLVPQDVGIARNSNPFTSHVHWYFMRSSR